MNENKFQKIINKKLSDILDKNSNIDYNVKSWVTERTRLVGANKPQNTTGGEKLSSRPNSKKPNKSYQWGQKEQVADDKYHPSTSRKTGG